MGARRALPVDLTALADAADRERDRLTELLTEGCRALDPRPRRSPSSSPNCSPTTPTPTGSSPRRPN